MRALACLYAVVVWEACRLYIDARRHRRRSKP